MKYVESKMLMIQFVLVTDAHHFGTISSPDIEMRSKQEFVPQIQICFL